MSSTMRHSELSLSVLPLPLLLLLLLLLRLSSSSAALAWNIVEGGATQGAMELFPPTVAHFNATLDHFRYEADVYFPQKYLVFDKFWRKSSGPILLYLGNEGQIEDFYNNTGLMFEVAPELEALIVFVEHRYYGTTQPFGNKSLEPKNVVYLTIEQAMADFAIFIDWFRTDRGCPIDGCKTVLFGGSYGGMLAAWFRLKYPHLSVGALAASAPVDFYPGKHKQEAFWNATMHTFRKYGGDGQCDVAIEKAYAALMDDVAAGKLSSLSKALKTCRALDTTKNVGGKIAQYVRGVLASLAMVDYPVPTTFVAPLPANPVKVACGLPVPQAGHENDGRILWLNSVLNIYLNYTGGLQCHDIDNELFARSLSSKYRRRHESSTALGESLDMVAWNYQACTELILEPLTSEGLGFYPPDENQIPAVEAACKERFEAVTRPRWMPISTGASSLRYATNIIFSNGEKDPWRVGKPSADALGIGVLLLDIPDSAHHEDLRFSVEQDPPSVFRAKTFELQHIKSWVGHQSEGRPSVEQRDERPAIMV